jgi:hypothetical protein
MRSARAHARCVSYRATCARKTRCGFIGDILYADARICQALTFVSGYLRITARRAHARPM